MGRGRTPEEKHRIGSYLTIYRSLKMADILLAAPEKNITAVMGAMHFPLVKKFLENPKLRERYRRLWKKTEQQI